MFLWREAAESNRKRTIHPLHNLPGCAHHHQRLLPFYSNLNLTKSVTGWGLVQFWLLRVISCAILRLGICHVFMTTSILILILFHPHGLFLAERAPQLAALGRLHLQTKCPNPGIREFCRTPHVTRDTILPTERI